MMNKDTHIRPSSYDRLQEQIDRQVADIQTINAAEDLAEQHMQAAVEAQNKPWWKHLFKHKPFRH